MEPLQCKRLAFIGGGNMAEALIRGLLKAEALPADKIIASAPRQQRITALTERYGIASTQSNVKAVRGSDLIVLSVKPQILEKVLQEIAAHIQADALIVSVAAGVTIDTIAKHLKSGMRIGRAMPNTPAIVDAGATAIAGGEHASEADLAQMHTIFSAVGMVTQVDEALLDAVTGLSGSGPAYVFMIIEALADAGVKVGLSRRQSQELAAQTVLGSAKLLMETGDHPGVLKDRVTSPGGTAIAGLHTLEEGGLRTTLINAVVAATARSKELGQK
jgi:pyrroline-5-carboxylate reductase